MRDNSEEPEDAVQNSRSALHGDPLEPRRISGCLSWLFAGAVLLGCVFGIALCSRLQIPGAARKTDSRVLGKGIADAITQFYGDYRHLPVPAGQTAGAEDISTDTSPESGLIRILLGKEPEGPAKQNLRNINYLEGMKAAKRGTGENGPKWVSGLVLDEGTGAAVDGWGNFYRIRLDTNGDGEMSNPNTEEVRDGRTKLSNRVILWSAGKDRSEETWDDNVKSWD